MMTESRDGGVDDVGGGFDDLEAELAALDDDLEGFDLVDMDGF